MRAWRFSLQKRLAQYRSSETPVVVPNRRVHKHFNRYGRLRDGTDIKKAEALGASANHDDECSASGTCQRNWPADIAPLDRSHLFFN
jgi:hypothetical protein